MDYLNKADLRHRLMADRNSLTPEDTAKKSKKISQSLINTFDFKAFKIVHCYLSLAKEVNTQFILEAIRNVNSSIKICVPIISGQGLIHSFITPRTSFIKNLYGIPEPRQIKPVDTKLINLVIIPVLGFDSSGNRLGYGKGYYDKFLSKLTSNTTKVGLSFQINHIKEEIPAEQYDVPLDYVLTEERTYKFIL